MAVIDFSRWNTMPWWQRAGFKSRDEAWAAYNSSYCILSAGELEHQQRMAREINQKARNKC